MPIHSRSVFVKDVYAFGSACIHLGRGTKTSDDVDRFSHLSFSSSSSARGRWLVVQSPILPAQLHGQKERKEQQNRTDRQMKQFPERQMINSVINVRRYYHSKRDRCCCSCCWQSCHLKTQTNRVFFYLFLSLLAELGSELLGKILINKA